MIVDLLSEIPKHRNTLPAAIVRGIEALSRVDLAAVAAGRYDLEGDDLYYVVQNATPRAADEIRSEAHFVYADIHLPISAAERYGFAPPDTGLAALEAPVEGSDVAFYPTKANEFFMDISPGSFVVFLPGELHRSCLSIGDQSVFRKVVIKVHSKLLGL